MTAGGTWWEVSLKVHLILTLQPSEHNPISAFLKFLITSKKSWCILLLGIGVSDVNGNTKISYKPDLESVIIKNYGLVLFFVKIFVFGWFKILKDRFHALPHPPSFLRVSVECSKMAVTRITIFSNTEDHCILSEIDIYYTRYVAAK